MLTANAFATPRVLLLALVRRCAVQNLASSQQQIDSPASIVRKRVSSLTDAHDGALG